MNGTISLWDIKKIQVKNTYIGQTMLELQAHDSCVVGVDFCDSFTESKIIGRCMGSKCFKFTSSGMDGRVMVWDLRNPWVGLQVYRNRCNKKIEYT